MSFLRSDVSLVYSQALINILPAAANLGCLQRYNHRDFPRPDLGPISLTNSKTSKNFLKWCTYIIPNFLVLHFGENFNENPNKNSFTFFMQIFMSF